MLRQSYCQRQNNLLTDDKRVAKCILRVVLKANHPKMDEKMRNLQDPEAKYNLCSNAIECLFVMTKQLVKIYCPLVTAHNQMKSNLTDTSIYIYIYIHMARFNIILPPTTVSPILYFSLISSNQILY